ncbi:hypothetical protein BA188_13090 [Aeromonas hydrophila]|nr:hypothetical protein OI72_06055 [Aeromonas hydrophila]OFC46348.1 hypothetical protein BA189_12165 [Aeromonas hydrophila]OFC52166.1 hypothetical protein BA188_13090 [Aeromonas hydrophila]
MDRPGFAAVLAALAEYLAMSQTVGFNMGDVLPGCLRGRAKYRHFASVDTFPAKSALAAQKIHAWKTTIALDQDLFRASREAVTAAGAVGGKIGPGDGPGQLHPRLIRCQATPKQTATRQVDPIRHNGSLLLVIAHE